MNYKSYNLGLASSIINILNSWVGVNQQKWIFNHKIREMMLLRVIGVIQNKHGEIIMVNNRMFNKYRIIW